MLPNTVITSSYVNNGSFVLSWLTCCCRGAAISKRSWSWSIQDLRRPLGYTLKDWSEQRSVLNLPTSVIIGITYSQ